MGDKLYVVIKRMELSDLTSVMEIEKEAYGKHHWSRESFVGELDNNLAVYFVVIDKEEKVLAYCGMWQIFEEAHLTTIAVKKEFCGLKIAQALLIKCFDDCREKKIKFLTLEVRESNFKAQKLYEKFGMKSLGIRKRYYQDNNENALIMWSENIFHEKFKTLYNQNKAQITGLNITYE